MSRAYGSHNSLPQGLYTLLMFTWINLWSVYVCMYVSICKPQIYFRVILFHVAGRRNHHLYEHGSHNQQLFLYVLYPTWSIFA